MKNRFRKVTNPFLKSADQTYSGTGSNGAYAYTSNPDIYQDLLAKHMEKLKEPVYRQQTQDYLWQATPAVQDIYATAAPDELAAIARTTGGRFDPLSDVPPDADPDVLRKIWPDRRPENKLVYTKDDGTEVRLNDRAQAFVNSPWKTTGVGALAGGGLGGLVGGRKGALLGALLGGAGGYGLNQYLQQA